MNVSVFDVAKEVSLPNLAEYLGQGRAKDGRILSPCCGVPATTGISATTGAWRWRCSGCAAGGTVIDWVAAAKKLPPIKAARAATAILGNHPEFRMRDFRAARRSDPEAAAAVARVIAARPAVEGAVLGYLASRGISKEVAMLAVQQGWLRCLPPSADAAKDWLVGAVGADTLERAGMIEEGSGRCVAAGMPLVFVNADASACEFRSLGRSAKVAKAIQIGNPLTPVASRNASFVAQATTMVASGMEMLAYIASGHRGDQEVVIGECGAGAIKSTWASWLAERYPGATEVTISVVAGRSTGMAKAVFDVGGFSTKVESLQHDWGDLLVTKAKKAA